jgi:transposase-like protein
MRQAKVGRAWRRWTEDEARAALEELARTGERPETFARRHGISAQRLRYWRKQLANTVATPPAFVAMTLPEAASARRQVEVRIDEVVIAVADHADVELVASLVAAIVRQRCAC